MVPIVKLGKIGCGCVFAKNKKKVEREKHLLMNWKSSQGEIQRDEKNKTQHFSTITDQNTVPLLPLGTDVKHG